MSSKESPLKFKTIDLFAGIGGFRLGFEGTGKFETVYANDFDKYCKITYDANFKTVPLTLKSITDVEASEIPDFDVLLGGFPCQAFSVAGYRKGFDDEKGRGNLFVDIVRILEAKKPQAFLLENVKNLETHDDGNTFNVIKQALEENGYHIKHAVLNSMDYGNVPQNRERIYIVGFRDEKAANVFKFPEKKKRSKDISDVLQNVEDVNEKYFYNGKPLFDKIKDEISEENEAYQWRRIYVRKNKSGVFPTLTANMGMGGHNVPIVLQGDTIRKITPREAARVQGFPESYKLPSQVVDSQLYKQFGNSVSVPVIKRIAENLYNALHNGIHRESEN